MVRLEVIFLVFWMEFSWAIRTRLYIAYLVIPLFFYLLSSAVQSIRGSFFPLHFLPSAISLSFLFSSFLIAFGFTQKGRSFLNLSRLSGSPPIYIFLGEVSFSSFVAIIQALLLFLLIRIFSGIGGFGSFLLFLIVSFLFSLLYTLLLLSLALPLKFKPLESLYSASGFLLISLLFSTVFLPLDSLPSALRILGLLNPLTYGVEAFGWALGAHSSIPYSQGIFFGLYLALPTLCLYILARKSLV